METVSIDLIQNPGHPDVSTLRIKGALCASTLAHLENALQTVLSASPQNQMIVDLTETHDISSAGWGLLIGGLNRFREFGGNFLLAGMKPDVRDTYELLGFDKTIPSFPNAETALRVGCGKTKVLPVQRP